METITVTNPMTGEILGNPKLADRDSLQNMVNAAVAAQAIWAEKPVYERAEYLYRFADALERDAEYISQLSSKEMAKPILQSRGETMDGVKLLRAAVERAKHLYGEVLSDSGPGFEGDLVFTKREPLGTIACIIPFNFPIELTFQKIAPALVMGNTVLVKAPSSNPLAVLALDRYAKEAGFPEGVVQFFIAERDVVSEKITTNGLSSGLMTSDMNRAFRVGSKLKAGGTVVNGSGGYRHLDQPFGGFKQSGLGREGISISLEEFSHVKVYVVKGAFN